MESGARNGGVVYACFGLSAIAPLAPVPVVVVVVVMPAVEDLSGGAKPFNKRATTSGAASIRLRVTKQTTTNCQTAAQTRQ